MKSAERVGIWFVVAALVGMAVIVWAALNKRIDEVTPSNAGALSVSPTSSTPTTTPLAAEVAGLRRAVTELQATRGLSGPEVRALVETLLPAPNNPPTDEACSEPPCSPPTTARAVVPRVTAPPTTTTEKKRRRPR